MKGTIKEKAGYQYSNGSSGKKWVRGRTMFSEGKEWIGNNTYIPRIIKTNLDTGEMVVANLQETKRFLTLGAYAEYVREEFLRMNQR